MSPSLVICVLFIGHLFSSSASLLNTGKLASEELSQATSLNASLSRSPVTTLNSSITTLVIMTGYVVVVDYSDSLCTAPIYADVQVLNTCFEYYDKVYKKIIATSYSVSSVTYTDSLCTLGAIPKSQTYTDGACVGYSKTFISSTSTLAADVATASER